MTQWTRFTRPTWASLVIGAAILMTATPAGAQSEESRTDEVFARWDRTTSPGCAVGVDRAGQAVLRRAYGQADLEWGMPNTPETIFENGSVSKQFTAAAIVLLALDGKLTLEDDVRTYVPELPDYPETITLRHLLNHTSGLRDWGAVAGLSGWGRSVRTHTQQNVIDILSRQSALNFPPGHEYSYSNSGYNLLAIIVSRVSGMPFAEFSKQRIFEPLGMANTQWRDDYRRIVPGRSAAYSAEGDGTFSINRPIEHVHGNGGLLTTVGDLALWNRSLDEASLAGPEFVEMLETPGVLNDGRTIDYMLGLVEDEAFGLRAVVHGGATSGYRAGLVRFPDQELGVAVLCNVTNANGVGLAMDVAEIYLGDRVVDDATEQPEAPRGHAIPADALAALGGIWVSTMRPANVRLDVDEDGRLMWGGANGDVLIPRSDTEFEVASEPGRRVVFAAPVSDGPGEFEVRYQGVLLDTFVPLGWEPTASDLDDFTGVFHSDDADVTFQLSVDDGRLMLDHPVLGKVALTPVYEDAFRIGGRVLRFRRLTGGRVHELSVAESRIYDMRFRRTH